MKPQSELTIEEKKIGLNNPTYFIADIAANHDGSLDRAIELIHLAAQSGADAAKFQHFSAKTIVSDYGFREMGRSKSHQASWKKSVFEVYEDATVNLQWTQILKDECFKAGITFFTSPYSFELVDYIDNYVPAYKVGSGDITWLEIIQYIASKNKPYLVATGASNLNEVSRAVNAGLALNPQIALLQCNTNYTGTRENLKYINLHVLKTYRAMYPEMVLGLSDHTPGNVTVLGAIALGARIIEKHFTDDVNRVGPDHAFSMNPSEWREMVERSRDMEAALGVAVKDIEKNEKDTVILQRRCIRYRKDLYSGHCLSRSDLEILRPAPEGCLMPYEIEACIGKKLRNTVLAGKNVTWTDLE